MESPKLRLTTFAGPAARVLIFSGLVFFLSLAQASAEEYSHYQIEATIDAKEKLIQAQQIVSFTNQTQTPLTNLYFHIYPNRRYSDKEKRLLLRYAGYFKMNFFPDGFQEAQFKIDSVTHQEKPLAFAIEGDDQTLLNIPLTEPLNPGQSITLEMKFSLKLPHTYGRLGWHDNIMTLSRWYPILSVYSSEGWQNYPFYPFHRPFFSDAATYSIRLTVPENQVLAHSGELIEERRQDDGTKTLAIEASRPIREFSLSLSPDYNIVEEDYQGIHLRVYYLPGHLDTAQKALANVKDVMSFYTQKFGPYAYKNFSIVSVYLGYGGEQMSNMAFIDTRVFELPGFLNRYFDFLISHETGHQWFYNMVGVNEYKEMWLEEGLHSYFILQYLENKYGSNADIIDFPRWAKWTKKFLPEFTFRRTRDVRYKIISRIGLDEPVVGDLSSFQEPSSIFALAYGKGSSIAAMLKELIGPETFERVFKRLFEEYRFKNVSVKDFERICQEESGYDLTAFFEQWLYTNKHFDVAVDKVKGNEVTLRNKGGITMPIDMEVTWKDGTKENLTWDAQDKTKVIASARKGKIKKIRLDPKDKILDWDRTNNTWPRNINIKPVPIYFGLYDIPALMPDESCNVVFGPEIADGGLGVKASWQKPYEQIFYAGTAQDFGDNIQHSRVGYQLNNIFGSLLALGFEIKNRSDYDDGDEDLVSGKVFLRQELWPFAYGIFDKNDHVSLYLIRNQGLNKTLISAGAEDARNTSYLKREEAIVGLNLHFARSGIYPDPHQGYSIDAVLENSGHFLGATQAFNRASFDTSFYVPVTLKSHVALRFKPMVGSATDKNLFELGGPDGVRGYDRKTLRGSNGLLGSVEYRFPIKENLKVQFFDNIFGLESISGAVFFDAGQAWYDDFDESTLRKTVGGGVRMTFNVGSFLEKAIFRIDVGQAINDDSQENPRVWLGVNQPF